MSGISIDMENEEVKISSCQRGEAFLGTDSYAELGNPIRARYWPERFTA
jgi:hypothetical protein